MKVGDKCENECAGSLGSAHSFRCLVLWIVYWYPGRSRIRVLLLIPDCHHRFENCYRLHWMKHLPEAACRTRRT